MKIRKMKNAEIEFPREWIELNPRCARKSTNVIICESGKQKGIFYSTSPCSEISDEEEKEIILFAVTKGFNKMDTHLFGLVEAKYLSDTNCNIGNAIIRRREKMIRRAGRYLIQKIDWKKLLEDSGNNFTFTGQRPSRGKVNGVIATLQWNEDNSEPVINRETGQIEDNNYLSVMDVTIVDAEYPLNFNKGDKVSIADFRQDVSYYINYNLILRVGKIYPYVTQNATNEK